MGIPGPHPTSESAPYAIRTPCRPPAPGPWTPPLPWTHRARPPELGKPRGRGFPQRPPPASSSSSRSTRQDRCPSQAHRRVSRICHYLAIVDSRSPSSVRLALAQRPLLAIIGQPARPDRGAGVLRSAPLNIRAAFWYGVVGKGDASAMTVATTRISGRACSVQEMTLIREIVQDCSGLSRMELARTVCELLRWRRPNGRLKARECCEFLKRLDAGRALVLPDKRRGREVGSVTRVTWAAAGEPGPPLVDRPPHRAFDGSSNSCHAARRNPLAGQRRRAAPGPEDDPPSGTEASAWEFPNESSSL